MIRRSWFVLVTLGAVLVAPSPAPACSLCGGDIKQRQTLRQGAEKPEARLILYGTLANPRLKGASEGATDLRIEAVLRNDPFLGGKKVIELPRYIPADAKDPPRYLVFCDVLNGKLDAYHGIPVKTATVVEYLKGAMALDPKDRTKSLLYFFKYLEHADKDVANDAFLEFAKANDQEIGQVGPKLSAERIRGWLKDAQTPSERLGLYSFLLGACGSGEDAALLRSLLQNPTERTNAAYDGMLSGYIQLRPQEGWDLAIGTLRDERKPFAVRFATLRTLRFYHGWKPDESRLKVLRGLEAVLGQGDLADLAIEDLRRWQVWDLTKDVLDLYGKKSHDAPLMRQAIVRYALTCPKAEASRFVAERRRQEPELVKDVEESLEFEKGK